MKYHLKKINNKKIVKKILYHSFYTYYNKSILVASYFNYYSFIELLFYSFYY